MNREKYGERFNDHLFEQYKLYVEMTDRISDRRERTNRFYLSLMSLPFPLLLFLVDRNILSHSQTKIMVFMLIGIFGLGLSLLWMINIHSYRQLNSGKFKVIHAMEQFLPYPCYTKEWKILGKGKKSQKYLPLTHIEQWVPIIFAIPYFLLLIYSLWMFIKVKI